MQSARPKILKTYGEIEYLSAKDMEFIKGKKQKDC